MAGGKKLTFLWSLCCDRWSRGAGAALRRPVLFVPLMHPPAQHLNAHVLILGNGPAGISLSAFLSGIIPFYNKLQRHPNEEINKHLLESNESLIDQELSWIENVEQLVATGRPLSVLYDTLTRPGADIGEINPSCLRWERRRDRAVDHIVLGETPIGGSWHNYDPEMMAVSFSSWLDLPGYSINEYLEGTPLVSRLPSVVIAAYMEAYTKKLGIRKNFRPCTKVHNIKKDGDVWLTTGQYSDGRWFTVTSNLIVLACGKTKPRILNIPFEETSQKIVYDVPSLKRKIVEDTENGEEYTNGQGPRVVVVGDGISSADVVRHCLDKGIPILHVMRRNENQLRSILMSRLTATHYAEYTTVYRLMIGREQHPLYKKSSGSVVIAVDDESCTISTPKGEIMEQFGLMAVCIGRETEVHNIFDEKVDLSDYQSVTDPSLFSVGAVCGDHFVRYLIGGSLHVAREILKGQCNQLNWLTG